MLPLQSPPWSWTRWADASQQVKGNYNTVADLDAAGPFVIRQIHCALVITRQELQWQHVALATASRKPRPIADEQRLQFTTLKHSTSCTRSFQASRDFCKTWLDASGAVARVISEQDALVSESEARDGRIHFHPMAYSTNNGFI